MAPQETAETATNDGTEEISDSQDQQQESAEETSDQDQQQDQSQQEQQAEVPKPPAKDPQKLALQADLVKERKALKAANTKVTELEAQIADLAPKAESVEGLQHRIERLEGFLQAAGGPLSKALDSRSFTHALFETDEDIADIVKSWQKVNPTATSTALGSAAAEPGKGKIDPNVLLRAAAGK